MEDKRSIVIIGAGLSGLALGAYIKDAGFNSIILEQSKHIGGVLQTRKKDGFLLETGANTATNNLALQELISILHIQDKVIELTHSPDRYILKNNKPRLINPKPLQIILSPLLSISAKWKLFREQSVPSQSIENETVGAFFERRFGKEIVETFINPMIAGIYAGDPYQLNMQSVFPQVLQWEQNYGSVTKGLKEEKKVTTGRTIITFEEGMGQLIEKLESYIGTENILCETEAKQISRLENGKFAIAIKQNNLDLEIEADVVVLATPSHVSAKFIEPISPELAKLMNLHHPKLGVIHLGYNQSALKKPFHGFGFLVPEKEQKSFLGAIANSSFLPNRAPDGTELFTLFIGGTRQEHLLQGDSHVLINDAIKEFEEIMQISEQPLLKEFHLWDSSIPQFGETHQMMLEGFEFFENNVENLHFLGNFRSGLSISECIRGAKRAHGNLIKDYSISSYKKSKALENSLK